MPDPELDLLLELWHLAYRPEAKTVRRLFDDYASLISYLSRIHRLSGGRRDGFEMYEAGLPTTLSPGWLPQAKLAQDVFYEAMNLRIERDALPVFAFFEAGFQNDREYTPSADDGGWSKVRDVPESYFVEVFADDAVAPVVLQKAAGFYRDGISADYARNIAGGIAGRSVFASQGFTGGMAGGFSEPGIRSLFHAGVPWDYANQFVEEYSPLEEPVAIIRFFKAGIDAGYAVAGIHARLDAERVIEAWAAGVAVEYLTA